MIKLLVVYLLITLLPLFQFVTMLLIKKKLKESTAKKKELQKFLDDVEKLKYEKDIDEIYDKESKPYYLRCRQIFNQLMKAGVLAHRDIVYLEELLEKALGGYMEHYQGYKFKNNAHKIYVLMKSTHIDVDDWKKILYFLTEMQKKSEKQPAPLQQVASGSSNVILLSQHRKKES